MQPHVEVAVPPAVIRFHQSHQSLELPRQGCRSVPPRHPRPRSVVVIGRPAIPGLLGLPFCAKAYLILWGNVPITFLRWRMIDLRDAVANQRCVPPRVKVHHWQLGWMITALHAGLADRVEFVGHGLCVGDPEFALPSLPIPPRLRLFPCCHTGGSPGLPEVQNLLHTGTHRPLLAVGPALAGEEFRLRTAVSPRASNRPGWTRAASPAYSRWTLITSLKQDPMRFDRALMPEGVVLLGAPALGVVPVIACEVGGRRARVTIVLPSGDEQVEMGLLALAVER